MINCLPSTSYIFVIDTDSYAGNFERELCAYMTGLVGDCEVGREAVELYEKECSTPLVDLVNKYVPDEHGCHRPCSIFPSLNYFNDGYGNCHKISSSIPEEEVLILRNNSIDEYSLKYKLCNGEKGLEQDRLKKLEPLKKFPAYYSVAIFLRAFPNHEDIYFLKERAQKFVNKTSPISRMTSLTGNPKFQIEGFRLVTKTVSFSDLML